jgi:hypothetical protein
VQTKNKIGMLLTATPALDCSVAPSSISVVCRCLYDREKQKGNANRATLAVARKLVAYLMSVHRGRRHFLLLDQETSTAA